MPRVITDQDKFDFQLKLGKHRENHLANRLSETYGDRVELKSERKIWETSSNLCIEVECNGHASGLTVCEAEWWAHELIEVFGDDYYNPPKPEHVVMTMFLPMKRLVPFVIDLMWFGKWIDKAGDKGRTKVVLVPLYSLPWMLKRYEGDEK